MTELAARRAPRRNQTIDVTAFADDVADALAAFRTDVSYAVQMARAAVTINRKRAFWKARRDLREAEATAHNECNATPAFECHATSACGTGDCKFATGEYAQLTVAAGPGVMRRQQYPHQHYSPDAAVTALVELRS